MRKPKRYHYIYKTTCKVTGNFYVGMHSTDELEDGYLGSGIKLWHSIRKHGKENHEREILEFLTDRDSLRLREKEIVNEQFLENPKCMNLTTGGHGGFDLSYNECVKNGAKGLAAQKWLKENDPEWVERRRKNASIGNKKRIQNGFVPKGNTEYKWSEETRNRITKTRGENKHQQGDKNSQHGTCWITNGTENKKIKRTDELPSGWSYGRKIKTESN